jgi:GT2 family glycosyltransferase
MKFQVSVVITTLGGSGLAPTIAQLQRGTVIPAEILVCIPEPLAASVSHLAGGNVRIIPTPVRGQVGQRAFGFRFVNSPMVLQLDDDVYLDERCIEFMARLLAEKGEKSVVGPSLFIRSTGEYAYPPRPPSDERPGLSHRILNGAEGYRSGRMARSGFCFGFEYKQTPQETDWLPGGCVMQWRANLLMQDYYPYPGKAYAEDLFHSYLLRKAGMRLYMSGEAKCFFDYGQRGYGGRLKDVLYEARAVYKFARFAGKEAYRLPFYYLLVLRGLLGETVKHLLWRVSSSFRSSHV